MDKYGQNYNKISRRLEKVLILQNIRIKLKILTLRGSKKCPNVKLKNLKDFKDGKDHESHSHSFSKERCV